MAAILIADDDELLLRFLEHKLQGQNHTTIAVTDGLQALQAATEQKPDLIVLDVMMPDMDGLEVLNRLKASSETDSIPVLMLTARKLEKDVVAGLSLGAQDYLVKPFMAEEFLIRVQKLLEG